MTDRPERDVEGLDLVEGTLRGLDKMLRTQPGPTLWITKPSLEQVRDALRTLQSERDRLEAENERLREALLEVDRLVTKDQKETPSGLVAAVTDVVDVALDALGPETEADDAE